MGEAKETAAVLMYVRDPSAGRPKVLLQHRSDDAPTHPDHFSPFGGSLEGRETPRQAARREMLEELGLTVDDLKFVGSFDHVVGGRTEKRTHLFVSPLQIDVELLRKQQREGKGLGLFSFREAEKLRVAREDRALIALAKWHFDYSGE